MSVLAFDTRLFFARPRTWWEDSVLLRARICLGIPIHPTISPDMFETNKIEYFLLKNEKWKEVLHQLSLTFLCTMPERWTGAGFMVGLLPVEIILTRDCSIVNAYHMPGEWPTRSESGRINNRTKLVWGSHFSLGLLPKRICELTPEGQKPVVRSYRMQQRG